jgi:predicted acyl esterase
VALDAHWDALGQLLSARVRCFAKGEKLPRVQLAIRQLDGTASHRDEQEFPIARTEYRELFLDANQMTLSATPPLSDTNISYDAFNEGVSFSTGPFDEETEITGFVTHLPPSMWTSSLRYASSIRAGRK